LITQRNTVAIVQNQDNAAELRLERVRSRSSVRAGREHGVEEEEKGADCEENWKFPRGTPRFFRTHCRLSSFGSGKIIAHTGTQTVGR